MATTLGSLESRTGLHRGRVEPVVKTFMPVKLFAWVGAGFLAMIVYSMSAWIISGNATRTPTGADPVPTYMKVAIHGWEVLGIPVLVAFLWRFMVKPWRREGRITSDGLFCVAFVLLWWQDPMSNWIGPAFTYNSEFVNFGNWTNNIPGWFMPNAKFVGEPPLWVAPIYVYLIFGMCILGCGVLRKAKARWPQLSPFGLVMVCAGFFFFLDLVLEPAFMSLGFWSYPGAISWLTLFHGHYYQFPIYEALLWGAFAWCGWTCLRYFKNDKGESLAERGASELRLSPKKQTWVRFLAIVGATQSIFLFGYNIPMQFFVANSDPWINDIADRSYLQQNICGTGTDYHCWGPNVPYPRGLSPHLDPNGHLVK